LQIATLATDSTIPAQSMALEASTLTISTSKDEIYNVNQ
jgi:hypothetical protein